MIDTVFAYVPILFPALILIAIIVSLIRFMKNKKNNGLKHFKPIVDSGREVSDLYGWKTSSDESIDWDDSNQKESTKIIEPETEQNSTNKNI